MATVTGFRTPEEAALDLELPLLGTLETFLEVEGPVAAAAAEAEGARRLAGQLADRVLRSSIAREGSVGLIGDVPASRRARMAGAVAAALAAARTTVLVDADLRHGHLSFDDRRRAQEGLVDVLRYGVRSPRVVSPTLTPGLSLLPVGSRTVDLAGTYGAEAMPHLFAELRRGGELIFVNGPDAQDAAAAAPLLDEVAGWILVHEIGVSDPERTRGLRDRLGRSACVGVLVLGGERRPAGAPLASTEAIAAGTVPKAAAPVTGAEPSGIAPVVSRAEAKRLAAKPAPQAKTRVIAPPEEALAPKPGAPASASPTVETIESAWTGSGAPVRRGRPRGLLFGGVSIVVLSLLAFLIFGRERREERPTGMVPAPSEEPAPGRGAVPGGPAVGGLEPGSPSEEVGVPRPGELSAMWPPPSAENSNHGTPGGESAGAAETEAEGGTETARAGEPSPADRGSAVVSPGPASSAGVSPGAGTPGADTRGPAAPGTKPTATPPPSPPTPAPTTAGTLAASGTPASTPPASESGTSVTVPERADVRSAPPEPAAPAPLGAVVWGVHVSSVKSSAGAPAEAAAIAGPGVPTFIRRTEIPDKGIWWRIYVGPYGTRAEAERVAATLHEQGKDYAQVHRLRREEVQAGTGGREDR